MAFEALTPISRYRGDGVQLVFPTGFPVFEDGRHVKAVISRGTGKALEQRVLAYTDDYTVRAVTGGGECVTTAPVPDGWTLTLYLALPITQPRDFDNEGRLDAEEIEKGLDYVTALNALNASAGNGDTLLRMHFDGKMYPLLGSWISRFAAAMPSTSQAQVQQQVAAFNLMGEMIQSADMDVKLDAKGLHMDSVVQHR
jgi:hypothetical protein